MEDRKIGRWKIGRLEVQSYSIFEIHIMKREFGISNSWELVRLGNRTYRPENRTNQVNWV